MITRSKVHEQCIYKKKREKKKIHKGPHYIPQNMNTTPKTTPPFCHE